MSVRDSKLEQEPEQAGPVASGWSESPGGACTHWKAPPYHGAHPKRSLVTADATVRNAPKQTSSVRR